MAAQHRDRPAPWKVANLPGDRVPIPFQAEDLHDADLAKVVARVAAGGLPVALTVNAPSYPDGPGGAKIFEVRAAAVILSPADYLRLVLRPKAAPESA